jgi:hypothetical protein
MSRGQLAQQVQESPRERQRIVSALLAARRNKCRAAERLQRSCTDAIKPKRHGLSHALQHVTAHVRQATAGVTRSTATECRSRRLQRLVGSPGADLSFPSKSCRVSDLRGLQLAAYDWHDPC